MSQAVNVFISAAQLDSLTHCWSLKWQSLGTAVFGPREVKEESAQCLVQLLFWSCTWIEHSAKMRSVTTARGFPLETNVFTQAAKYGLLQYALYIQYKNTHANSTGHRSAGATAAMQTEESPCVNQPCQSHLRQIVLQTRAAQSFLLPDAEGTTAARRVEMRRFICYS